MKLTKIFAFIISSLFLASLFACEDENSSIGSSLASGEVVISLDTFYLDLNIQPVKVDTFDAKTGNLMLGHLYYPTYGTLDCSFITRLMCAAKLQIPDSLLTPERVDSCKIVMGAQRDGIIGDSLAPQKLSVFLLNKENQVPSDLTNLFNPEGYYNTTPLASQSYTVSNVSSSDSMFYTSSFVEIDVTLPKAFGMEIFEKYKNDGSIFQWPQTMAKEFLPGFYVKPTFGNGCIANITEMMIGVFYHSLQDKTTITDGDTITVQQHVAYSTVPFSVSPEVLSSNIISYKPSDNIVSANSLADGKCIITTPGGYMANFTLPVEPIIDRYNEFKIHLSTVNELQLYLPAEAADPESGISYAENILMVKTSEYEEFFNKNKIPDNITSFTGAFDATNSRYVFSSLRSYFINLLQKDTITPEDLQFTLVPVEITTETEENYYSSSTYVTKCVPLISKPTMTLIDGNKAMFTFSFTSQVID